MRRLAREHREREKGSDCMNQCMEVLSFKGVEC